jgi:hypothetical protein
MGTAREERPGTRRDFQSEAGLADAAWSGEGHQALVARGDPFRYRSSLFLAPNERRQRDPQHRMRD